MSSLRTVDRTHYRLIQLLQGFDNNGAPKGAPQAAEELRGAVEKLVSSPKHALLNCAGITQMPEPYVETFHFLDQQLKGANKKLRLVFASEALQSQLRRCRFGQYLTVSADLIHALEDLELNSADVSNRQFIKAFVNATLRTFFVQAKTQCHRGAIYVKTDQRARPLGDISGIVNVVTRIFSYAVLLSFPQQTFLNLMGRLLGETYTEITAENQDGAAELMNIIFGQAKLVLNLKGAGLKPQLPTIALAKDFSGLHFEGAPKLTRLDEGKTVVVPFSSDLGEFFIEVWMPEEFSDSLI